MFCICLMYRSSLFSINLSLLLESCMSNNESVTNQWTHPIPLWINRAICTQHSISIPHMINMRLPSLDSWDSSILHQLTNICAQSDCICDEWWHLSQHRKLRARWKFQSCLCFIFSVWRLTRTHLHFRCNSWSMFANSFGIPCYWRWCIEHRRKMLTFTNLLINSKNYRREVKSERLRQWNCSRVLQR